MVIKNCYIKKVLVAKEKDTVLEISKILRDTQRRHLVVIDSKEKPVGVLSVVDINNRVVAEEMDPKEAVARDIMTEQVISVDEEDEMAKALELMMDNNVLACPVTRKGKLIGIIELKEVVHKIQKKKIDEVEHDGAD